MHVDEANKLLAAMCALDKWQVQPSEAAGQAWAAVLTKHAAGLELQLALSLAADHYAASKNSLTPSDLVEAYQAHLDNKFSTPEQQELLSWCRDHAVDPLVWLSWPRERRDQFVKGK